MLNQGGVMSAIFQTFRQRFAVRAIPEPRKTQTITIPKSIIAQAIEIGPDDPLYAHCLTARGVLEIDTLRLESPALTAMKAAGVVLALPLVSQGELVGMISMGKRLSDQEYSADDRRLLGNLATQSATALRVAQLVRQQQIEARQRERIEQELRIAGIIQQTLLPREIPSLPGWGLSA